MIYIVVFTKKRKNSISILFYTFVNLIKKYKHREKREKIDLFSGLFSFITIQKPRQ